MLLKLLLHPFDTAGKKKKNFRWKRYYFFFKKLYREKYRQLSTNTEYRQLKNWVPLSSCFLCVTSARVASLAQMVKHLSAMQQTRVRSWVGKIPWRRKWQPTPVFLPGKSHGRQSLVDYCPWGRKELDTTERLHSMNK